MPRQEGVVSLETVLGDNQVSEAISLSSLKAQLEASSTEAVSQVYSHAESIAGRYFLMCCLSVAVLHDRFWDEPWPAQRPSWWNKEKAYPPTEPYWTYSVGHMIDRSPRTVYRR
jgi:hypothetical protein